MKMYKLQGGAEQAAEKPADAVILSIDSLAAAQEGQRLGPRKGSVDLLLGPRLFLVRRGRAADLKDSSALRLLNSKDLRVEFLQSSRRRRRISHGLENTQGEILRVVYPERAGRDPSLRSG